jgi:phage terminase Nu1 subunit (DNA packaging protein)
LSNRVTQAELARALGVAKSTVHKYKAAGRIRFDAQGLIDLDTARAQILATESPLPHHQARKAQFDEGRAGEGMGQATNAPPAAPSGPPAPAADPMPAAEKIGTALKLETYKLQKAKAETANIELDKLAGALVERAEVDFVLNDFGNTLRGLLESLPDRLAPAIAAHRGDVNSIHKALEDTAHDLLNEMADLMKRKMETLAT